MATASPLHTKQTMPMIIFLMHKGVLRQAWWHTPVISGFGRLRQDDLEFEPNMGYIARSCLLKNNSNNKNIIYREATSKGWCIRSTPLQILNDSLWNWSLFPLWLKHSVSSDWAVCRQSAKKTHSPDCMRRQEALSSWARGLSKHEAGYKICLHHLSTKVSDFPREEEWLLGPQSAWDRAAPWPPAHPMLPRLSDL